MTLIQALESGRPVAVFADGENVRYFLDTPAGVIHLSTPVSQWQSLAGRFPSLDWFERAISEETGLIPAGRDNLKPLRRHDLPYAFYRHPDLEVHQVPVGPVHAGIIEPGHFRFSVLGERVQNLEIRLGYQHRGMEKLFTGKALDQAILLAERVGSEPVAHALAFCRALEAATGTQPPRRAQVLRLVLLEMERIFQHLGHLAGLFTDIGYSFAAVQIGKVRALAQGQLEKFCGHRYGRNALRVGGLWIEPDLITLRSVQDDLEALGQEAAEVLGYALENPMVLDRMRYLGEVPLEAALELGMVGPAARASGVAQDLRQDEPLCQPFNPVVRPGGDVLARTQVYTEETRVSFELIDHWLSDLPDGPVHSDITLSDGEGWACLEAARGEVFWFVRLDDGKVETARVVDPSFKNWPGLEVAMGGEGLPDFPLCNKSFDLSYAGSDL
ncbi:MAG: hypothetical protein M1369_02710 [Deinococcus sp.]|nr:hypothetical protein [Deinococcus sp.]MCL5964683.1 hypothetical protein [Deinococcus sp.]